MKRKMEFSKSEVLEYLECKLESDEASQDEEQIYSDFKWSGKVNKNTYAWKNLIIEMRDIYENGYK